MPIIIPTITAENAHIYRAQVEQVQDFTKHLHIDLMDGEFTENKSIEINQVWWPENCEADIHVMFKNPQVILNELINLKPRLVIIQSESNCNITEVAKILHRANILCGVSVLAETNIDSIKSLLSDIDHLLIFSGNLGHQGGSKADLGLLQKINSAKLVNPSLKFGWDGGVNLGNVKQIAEAGVDIINVGGFIQKSENPKNSYQKLVSVVA